jgi:hypothetical protein
MEVEIVDMNINVDGSGEIAEEHRESGNGNKE